MNDSNFNRTRKVNRFLPLILPLVLSIALLGTGCGNAKTVTSPIAKSLFMTELSTPSVALTTASHAPTTTTSSEAPTSLDNKFTSASSIQSATVSPSSTTPIPTTTSATSPVSTTAISTISTTTNIPAESNPAYLDFSFEDSGDGGLNLYIRLSDSNYKLLAINGNVNIKIWDQPDPNVDVKNNPVLQEWNKVPITRTNFQVGTGFAVTVKYSNFTPDIGQSVFITLNFLAGKISLTSSQTITINRTGCCS